MEKYLTFPDPTWNWWKQNKLETILNSESKLSMPREDRVVLTRLATRIHKTGFVTPAIFFLEMTKPLTLLGSHAMVFFGPIITAFIRTDGYYRAAEIFENPDSVEFLLVEIERLEKEATQVKGEIREG